MTKYRVQYGTIFKVQGGGFGIKVRSPASGFGTGRMVCCLGLVNEPLVHWARYLYASCINLGSSEVNLETLG